ncbi:serine hydrolase domain-containing protein [Dokdonella fugitiva]|jgi:CubicO group peptidase (beta-lactamase class C family)|uniref:CubicO group peptidase (Beta-lactamase class C family) n=1 Tax=Dokdonella fugitiva TaxID=328517 RepID=A0A4V2S2D1_9GAMM|nr:serine hydrolase domain-containing protein [Dokdonella fugitiva]MBA8884405.1 CubicO group peptidase (beta-lactamase class C family) [Dokdonella fugitiva]TCO40010.1 CubicO group peptidase (beta-lactamase class C family) [Dokdonella fugitiva]
MDRSFNLGALAFALTLACVAPHAYADTKPATAATSASAAADKPSKTPHNATFILPAGWSQKAEGKGVILTPPENDGSRIAIMDASAKTADEAVEQGWKLLKLSPKFLVANDAAPRDGWEQRRFYDYDVPPNAKRAVYAGAFRRGTKFTVLVVDMDQALAEKRASQLGKINQRLLPADYKRESFKGRTAHTFDDARLKQVADFVEHMRSEYDVPGVAIGIVQDGKVVMAQGFGVRALGKPEKVDADTRFMIASNTKALTTLMLAKLVDAGKLDWNAHVTDVYPAFKLGNADTTKQVLVKHLICACTGLPRQDYEWLFEGEKQTPESVMATLGTMQPTSAFGELFQYSNPMAAAAGFIGGQIAYPGSELGKGYDQAMQSLVFDPLGMKDTTFDYAAAQTGDYAAPHGYDIDHVVRVMGMGLNDTIRASRPAGAAWSTVNDLLKYVQMEIRKGLLPDGTRYIGEAALLERRQPQIALGVDRDYAMALMVDKSDGVTIVDHGGDMDGFHSNMMWWPDQKVGAVILTNSDEGVMLRGPFKRRLNELMFDGEPQALATADANAKGSRASWDAQRKLIQYPADAAALATLAPRYHSDALGDIIVTKEGGKAWMDVGAFKSEIATSPQTDGSLAYVMIDPIASGFLLVRADTDTERRLIARDGQHEYVFTEVKSSADKG